MRARRHGRAPCAAVDTETLPVPGVAIVHGKRRLRGRADVLRRRRVAPNTTEFFAAAAVSLIDARLQREAAVSLHVVGAFALGTQALLHGLCRRTLPNVDQLSEPGLISGAGRIGATVVPIVIGPLGLTRLPLVQSFPSIGPTVTIG